MLKPDLVIWALDSYGPDTPYKYTLQLMEHKFQFLVEWLLLYYFPR